MKLKFSSDLTYQNDAIDSVINLFNGITTKKYMFSIANDSQYFQDNQIYNEIGYGNQILDADYFEIIQNNMQSIQYKNLLPQSKLDKKHTMTFDVEMETGTGKTYVFLKTIFKLNQEYGFNKFIITVPSIAIKEGVLKNLEITQEHFRLEFPGINYNFFEYDSSKLSNIREFQTSETIQIMIINIQSFDKDKNIFNIEREQLSGAKPIDLIKETNPIIIIDEPQSTASTDNTKNAINSLNPLFIIRYSATFKKRSHENLVYKLDAIDAYQKKIVKSIVVYGSEIINNNDPIQLVSTNNKKGTAKLRLLSYDGNYKTVDVFQGTSIYDISKRNEHKNLRIDEIIFSDNIVILNNGKELFINQSKTKDDELEIKKQQIITTVKTHLDTQLKLLKKNIKVLSLFFLDEVNNYRVYNKDSWSNGIYADIFEREFIKIAKQSKYQKLFENKDIIQLAKKIHNGYFSMDKSKKFKNSKGDSKDDNNTYQLIMRDKEKLLSFKEDLCFVFSHSALKEGWDNPNVFQVCTLNDNAKNEIRKRQQIGRGLRLCVNQNGERIYDENINVLSVVANESYEQFANDLQKELKDDGLVLRSVDKHSFMIKEGNKNLDEYRSTNVFKFLEENEYVSNGKVQDKCYEAIKNNIFKIPDVNEEEQNYIIKILEKTKEYIEVKNGREKVVNELNEEITSNEFKLLWTNISQKTKYKIKLDEDEFINKTKETINNKILSYPSKNLTIKKSYISLKSKIGVETSRGVIQNQKLLKDDDYSELIPGVIDNLIKKNTIKKSTIIKLICETELISKIRSNPLWVERIINDSIKEVQERMLVDGIQYIPIDDYYEQKIIEESMGDIYPNQDKHLYFNENNNNKLLSKYIKCDSDIEIKFLEDSLKTDYVTKIVKLPKKFVVNTPIGKYNPDWAILNENNISLIAETKGSTKFDQLRLSEFNKIKCGEKHFNAINKNIKFYVVNSINDLIEKDNYGK